MAKQEGTYTQMPNIILDDTTLNVYERSVLIHIARQTIGYGKKSDGISLSQFAGATGISKNKVIRTIADVKKKKLINVVKQTAASGGKSFNRYSLTLVLHKDYPSTSQILPLVLDKDIQKKIEQKKRERTSFNNILFSLPENIREKEINSFAESLDGIRNLVAYKVKLKQRIDKEDKQTLKEFESWYLSDKCYKLSRKYVGHKVGDYEVQYIGSYLDANMKNGGYGNSDWKFIVKARNKDEIVLRAYSTMEELGLDMRKGLSLGEVIHTQKV